MDTVSIYDLLLSIIGSYDGSTFIEQVIHPVSGDIVTLTSSTIDIVWICSFIMLSIFVSSFLRCVGGWICKT